MPRIKHTLVALAIVDLLAIMPAPAQQPVGAAFTYQGQLKQAGVPVNSLADFRVNLYDVENAGTPVDDFYAYDVSIIDGYMVGTALEKGHTLKKWQFFPKA